MIANCIDDELPSPIEACFSPFGLSSSVTVVNYIMYEFASKVTSIAINVCMPLLIANLGNNEFGSSQGKILWSYLATVTSILTSLSYLTFTSIFDYGCIKRKALMRFSFVAAFCLTLFILCFKPNSAIFASILVVCCRVSQSIASITYDSLLDAVSTETLSTHNISSRGSITGYVGMIAFLFFAAPVIAGVYFGIHPHPSTLWVEGTVPLMLMGVWYIVILIKINLRLPSDLGKGPPFIVDGGEDKVSITSGTSAPKANPDIIGLRSGKSEKSSSKSQHSTGATVVPSAAARSDSSEGRSADKPRPQGDDAELGPGEALVQLLKMMRLGLYKGTMIQWETMLEMHTYPDLRNFVVAFIFLSGALSTATSVAAIVAKETLQLPTSVFIAAFVVGTVSAILGTTAFKQIEAYGWMSAKQILLVNVCVSAALCGWALRMTSTTDVLVATAVGGSQIGALGAYTRSIFASLVPQARQTRFFSLYQFSQDSTGWIGSLIVASVTQAGGGGSSIYLEAIVISCLVEIGIGLPWLIMVDMSRGLNRRKEVDLSVAAEATEQDIEIGSAIAAGGSAIAAGGSAIAAGGSAIAVGGLLIAVVDASREENDEDGPKTRQHSTSL